MTQPLIHHTADVVLFAAGHVLLIERRWTPYQGLWALPGGHRDIGESSLEAAVRELAEETGITIAPEDLHRAGAYDTPGRDPRGNYRTVAYTATLPATLKPRAADDAADARWWPLANLPRLAFDHAEIIADAIHR